MEAKNNSTLIKNKLIFLVIMPVCGLILMASIFSVKSYQKHLNLNKLEKLVVLCTKTSFLIHELQIERGASAGYLGNKEEFYDLLQLQREKTNKRQNELYDFLTHFDKTSFNEEFNHNLERALKELENLNAYREKVDLTLIDTKESIAFYTHLNKRFLHTILHISKIASNAELSLHLISYVNFLFAKDVVGIQRALGTSILNYEYINKDWVNEFYNLRKIENIYMENYSLYASSESKKFYNSTLVGEDINEVNRIAEDMLQYKSYLSQEPIKNIHNSQYWFTHITSKINKLKKVDDYLINQINIKIQLLLNESKISIFMLIVSSSLITLIVFILGYIISRNIHNSIENLFSGIEKFFKYVNKEITDIPLIEQSISAEVNEKVKELNSKILDTKKILDKDYQFLEESLSLSKLYEYAMEKSNIILRISLDRKIKYANKLFLDISGYTKEELIGQPYSILKHDTVSIEEIDKVFRILEAGKMWKGTLKNLGKNNTLFYSIATVVPIKNKAGEILEYMQIRQDITEVINLHKELEDTQREVIYKMGEIVETRSEETGNHVKVVAEYSKLLALKFGLSYSEAELLKHASPMHDIGKVGIPDSLLNKPSRLTPEEFEIMKSHTTVGYEILKTSHRPILKASAIVAYEHHEKWDGSGYPRGLSGEDIHIYGRITAIADVFDALGSERAYKKAWKLNDVLEYFKEEKGKHFDPNLVDIFFDNLDEFLEIREKYK
ncbi:MAG: nitrate- and nitrite sensing domain-containing protein [Arcobacteraceae bacterium]|nr:nitrate- and nitrite sensing domain-containing protein [Arcobacteraceae bacterium]